MSKSVAELIADAEMRIGQVVGDCVEAVRQSVVIPYCNEHRLRFVSGNGIWVFFDAENQPIEQPEWLFSTLHRELNGEAMALYMFDYDGRALSRQNH